MGRDLEFMKLGIVISQTEPETVFNVLRLATYSLQQRDSVKIFLVGKGLELDRISDPKFNVREQAEAVLAGAGKGARAGRVAAGLFAAELNLNGHPSERLPNPFNVSFVGRIGGEVLEALEGAAASTGSACHSGRRELSPVLQAMRVPENIGLGAVRFSLGRTTTTDELDHLLDLLRVKVLKRQP